MRVKLWDGQTFAATDRKAAVAIVKRELAAWMQEGDYIGWHRMDCDGEDGLPSLAMVYDSDCEPTDAQAVVRE